MSSLSVIKILFGSPENLLKLIYLLFSKINNKIAWNGTFLFDENEILLLSVYVDFKAPSLSFLSDTLLKSIGSTFIIKEGKIKCMIVSKTKFLF